MMNMTVKGKRRVSVGREFNGSDGEGRRWVTKVVLALGCIFILGAAMKGFWDGDFEALQLIWSIVGPVYGAVSGYYFEAARQLE
jgi:hypothetical protein